MPPVGEALQLRVMSLETVGDPFQRGPRRRADPAIAFFPDKPPLVGLQRLVPGLPRIAGQQQEVVAHLRRILLLHRYGSADMAWMSQPLEAARHSRPATVTAGCIDRHQTGYHLRYPKSDELEDR
jgi:hypothetical protein